MSTRTTHRPDVRQTRDAAQWRRLVGPGHQFPVTTDIVLHYWPDRRR